MSATEKKSQSGEKTAQEEKLQILAFEFSRLYREYLEGHTNKQQIQKTLRARLRLKEPKNECAPA